MYLSLLELDTHHNHSDFKVFDENHSYSRYILSPAIKEQSLPKYKAYCYATSREIYLQNYRMVKASNFEAYFFKQKVSVRKTSKKYKYLATILNAAGTELITRALFLA